MESQATPKNKPSIAEVAFCCVLAGVAVALLFKARSAEAREAETEVTAPAPCALITEVAGEVDVLDSSRTHLLDSSKHAAVPCGGWVSVGKGSAELHHRDGFSIHVGGGSFVQFPEPNTDGKSRGDHAILFRGEVFARAGGGNGELRVITANARARVKRGSAIVVYSHEDEETQLIALDSQSSLENRFEPSRAVTVKAGEATSLNFRQLRVVPGTPRAVAIAALRPKFEDVRVPERDRLTALGAAHEREARIFATTLVDGDEAEGGAKAAPGHGARRDVASVGEGEGAKQGDPGQEVRERLKKARQTNPSPESYSSHVEDAQSQANHAAWVNRMVAGQSGAEAIVSPKRVRAKPSRSHVEVVDLQAGAGGALKARKLTPDDEEKLKLIDELSRIREE